MVARARRARSLPGMACLLHLTNGDCAADGVRAAALPGAVTVWADVLHDGPVRAALDDRAFAAERAAWLGDAGYAPAADAVARHAGWDAALAPAAAFGPDDEIVLWLEHDLFDQLLLARHLARAARGAFGAARLTMVTLDRFPGVEPFHGLGQLRGAQLATLFPGRRPVSDAQRAQGAAAWGAIGGGDPRAVAALAAGVAADGDAGALPFLGAALARWLEEYPAVDDGLARTERQLLDGLAAGVTGAHALFRDGQRREAAPYLGDTSWWARARALAAGARPLVTIAGDRPGPAPPAAAALALAADGAAVREGRADRIALAGFDRWIGGVRLHAAPGGDVAWRWDRAGRALVRGRA